MTSLVARARGVAGEALSAVVLHGSWVRGEATPTSRRDRALAFCGAEDLTPSDFYREQDADDARAAARLVVERVRPHVPGRDPD